MLEYTDLAADVLGEGLPIYHADRGIRENRSGSRRRRRNNKKLADSRIKIYEDEMQKTTSSSL